MEADTITFDRRQIYRPFLERLNPGTTTGLADVIVPTAHDPRDPDQPPIHEAFAHTAELSRGSQMALVGGIGSGKTTELHLTLKLLKRHADAVNVYVDLADVTDLSELNSGAILISIALQLFRKLRKHERESEGIKSAHKKLQELARGKTEWVSVEDVEPEEDIDEEPELVPVHTPGLLKPRFPPRQRKVAEVEDLLIQIATPLLEAEAQITAVIDGLDRLIRPERFRKFAEQDLRALREVKVTVIVAAPLLLWFDKSRFLQDYFDDVKHIPAAISDPLRSDFLNQILIKRGAAELMADQQIAQIASYSGGVLRDLITLARTSAEAAYRDDEDRIGAEHVRSAVRQLGKRYLIGLGSSQKGLIRRLMSKKEFVTELPAAKQLLVNRQVLEYFSGQHDSFMVHPALREALEESE